MILIIFVQIEYQVFETTMTRLNEYFAEAEKGSCSTYCEGCIGCITAYLVYMCSETHYEKVTSYLNYNWNSINYAVLLFRH